jgi:hypothetical protein
VISLKYLTVALLVVGCSAAAVPAPAFAQTMQWTDKGYVSVNAGVQAGSHDLDTNSTFTLYEETATVASSQKVKSGAFFDIGAAYRVWGANLLAGLSFTHTASDADVSVSASIPDPIRFDQPRSVNTSVSGAKHSEGALHLSAIWMIPVANKIDVGVFAGPSIFFIKQQAIGTPGVTEPGPTVATPLNEIKKTSGGLHAGVDVQYMIAKKWGVGGLARYTWGSATIAGATEKLTVGGFQIGAGARVRF